MRTHLYSAILLALPLFGTAQTKPAVIKNNAVTPRLNFWSLVGNSNLNDTVNFLGTTDQHRLTFKVNNSKSGFIDFDSLQSNTAFGYQTLVSLSQFGINNSAFGYQALNHNTFGFNNVAIGVKALSTNDGNNNIAVGVSALNANIGGGENVGIGTNALLSNQYGSDNVAVGLNALQNSTASSNTAIGHSAMTNNSTGTYNVTNGYLSSYNNTIGSDNTATGATALFNNTTGYYNTAFGMQALLTNQTGMRNTAVGAYADVTDPDLKNTTAIGFDAHVDASFKVVIGNAFVKSIGGAVSWTNYADERIKQDVKENVPGLAFINQLRPVTYHFNTKKEEDLLGKKDSLNEAADSKIEGIQFTGLLAQEVDKAAQKINYDFSGVDKTGKIMGLRYNEFVVPLVKAVQELSASNDAKDAKINDLEQRLAKLEALMNVKASSGSNQSITLNNKDVASLQQNKPNPFNNSTAISYTLPQHVSNAQIIITDVNGVVIKKSTVTSSGSITVSADKLTSGTYRYSLIVDGKLIDAKNMILSK